MPPTQEQVVKMACKAAVERLEAISEGHAIEVEGELTEALHNIVWGEEQQNFVISVVHTFQCYGGSEEGGWWYDQSSIEEVVEVSREDVDDKLKELQEDIGFGAEDIHNSNNETRISYEIGVVQPLPEPLVKPHYE